ncbi:MAG: prepilin-type N-terminal cleavage/methylation domain-containing protein [Planctomycetales bacterium]|nr:prepilin-type N-terminal cleavage/methylation domain-containing protein [Planctomycetales bacterium]
MRARSAFTLIELVVVIIIIAILAAVAVPKFINRADEAREAATLQSLSTLRSAIELFNADTGGYPTTGSITTDLAAYLKGPFPPVTIGGTSVATVTASASDPVVVEGSTGGWVYNPTTGDIRINLASHINQ